MNAFTNYQSNLIFSYELLINAFAKENIGLKPKRATHQEILCYLLRKIKRNERRKSLRANHISSFPFEREFYYMWFIRKEETKRRMDSCDNL